MKLLVILFIIKIFARINIFKLLIVNIPIEHENQTMWDEKFQKNVINLVIKVNGVEDFNNGKLRKICR